MTITAILTSNVGVNVQFFSLGITTFWNEFVRQFEATFITGDRYKLFFDGLGVTLKISFFAALFGFLIGTLLAFMKMSKTKKGKKTIFSRIASAYIDVIRGTPAVIQLLIMYNIILVAVQSKVLIAIIAFAINSGAYVAEIVRAGIMAVDVGQSEAGRALGLSKYQTMTYIIVPQAIKNVLPPLGNEFIVLLKETAIVGYVALMDLTKVSDFIISRTLQPYVPLLSTAFIYFVVIKIMTILLNKFERRLRKGDSR